MCSHYSLFVIVALLSLELRAMEPTFNVDTRGPNSVIAQDEKGRVVFAVTSERGRGWADITPVKGDWPQGVTLRFRLAQGKGFTALEELTVTTDRIVLAGGVKVTDLGDGEVTMRMRFAFVDENGKPETSQLNEKNQAGTLDIRVKRQEGWLDVVLPDRMLRGSGRVSLGWTDWHR